MRTPLHTNTGIAGVLISLFLLLAPIPFLSEVHEGMSSLKDFPYMVLRLGQAFVTPTLFDVSLEPKRVGSYSLTVEGVAFAVEIDASLTHDEIEALVDCLNQPETSKQFANSKRVRFEGWSPNVLPLRIQYRYILLTALISGLIGLFLLLKQKKAVR